MHTAVSATHCLTTADPGTYSILRRMFSACPPVFLDAVAASWEFRMTGIKFPDLDVMCGFLCLAQISGGVWHSWDRISHANLSMPLDALGLQSREH